MEKNEKQSGRMRSIVYQLQIRWLFRRIGSYICWDILLFLGAGFGWIVKKEMEILGYFSLQNDREILGKTIKEMTYVVKTNGEPVLSVDLYPIFCGLCIFLGIIVCLQILDIILGVYREGRSIRKILAPINEIAIKAEELSKVDFGEDKYQRIEDAITNLEPQESELLSFGDQDLRGIEVAMNNLLTRMRESYRQQARFVNDASHELRTPIAVIAGYVNMIARWGREDEKVMEESITALQRESSHMKKLVEQLLFLARGDSGKNQLEMSAVSLEACMKEIYEESLLIDEAHVYRFLCQEDMVVQADPQMLKQAVRVLVDNAAKYTPENDEILLSVGKNTEGIPFLQVQDTGRGMESNDVEHMFERFYRSDDVRKMKGTGLGLSIAKWIVDKHGGYFEILSRTELGTRIRIILPQAHSSVDEK